MLKFFFLFFSCFLKQSYNKKRQPSENTYGTRSKQRIISRSDDDTDDCEEISDVAEELTTDVSAGLSIDATKLSDSMAIPIRNKPKYIQHDLAKELLASLRLVPLKGEKWLWNGDDVSTIFRDDDNVRT